MKPESHRVGGAAELYSHAGGASPPSKKPSSCASPPCVSTMALYSGGHHLSIAPAPHHAVFPPRTGHPHAAASSRLTGRRSQRAVCVGDGLADTSAIGCQPPVPDSFTPAHVYALQGDQADSHTCSCDTGQGFMPAVAGSQAHRHPGIVGWSVFGCVVLPCINVVSLHFG
jgi:hypothetical protein